jgi:lipoyl(octanoyl) transferase
MILYLYLGRVGYAEALALQQEMVELRYQGRVENLLLLLEHPPVLTLGRNANRSNILATDELLAARGVTLHEINRGGDVTYHGPGQIVGYPIVDLREWKRDVVAYVRAIEQAIIEALAEFSIAAGRIPGCTGVWVDGRKVAAIGVHISRWVTSHGFALNHTTDLRYFQYIVPCGLTKPVTSMQELGSGASREQVLAALSTSLARQFQPSHDEPSRDRKDAGFSYTETYS